MRRSRTFSVLLIAGLAGVLALLAVFSPPSRPATARQAADGWSTPMNLSSSETQSYSPSLAVDPSGGIHIVWSEETEDGRSFIAYANWSDENMSPVNEIVSSPQTQVADYPTLAADSRGYLHLVWSGDATLYYSSVYAPLAGSAISWSEPQALEFFQNDISHPSLVIDTQDRLHLVYSIEFGTESGIYSMQSSDYGKNWTDPVTVYQNQRSDRMVSFARLAAGPEEILHSVWVEFNYPETFPPIGIRYASSKDGGGSWSVPISLADGPYHYPGITTRGSNEVHVVWSGTQPDRYKFHNWSTDDGQSWSDIYRNSEVGGFQGLPALVLDSNKTLHWITYASIFNINKDGLYHATWQDGAWSPGEVVMRNQLVDQNGQDVVAGVALGNQLHVAVQYPVASELQPDGWQYEIYYLRLELDSPAIMAAALATPTVSLLTPSPSTREATPTVRPTLDAWLATQPSSVGGGMLSALLTSTLGALVVLVVVILFVRRRQ